MIQFIMCSKHTRLGYKSWLINFVSEIIAVYAEVTIQNMQVYYVGRTYNIWMVNLVIKYT